MKKTEIIPAVLPRDYAELEDKMSLIGGMVRTAQIDVCDGQFTPVASWPYKKKDENFDKILSEEQGLPAWETLNYEIDLMVNKPEEVAEEWIMAGATRIIIHVESGIQNSSKVTQETDHVAAAIEMLKGKVEVGLALNIETPVSSVELYKDDIAFVQCMGIDQIGFQGQKFDQKVIDKIKEIKAAYPDLLVSVDGGVSLETAPLLIEAGADRLVVGSAIFDSENAIEAVQKFKRL